MEGCFLTWFSLAFFLDNIIGLVFGENVFTNLLEQSFRAVCFLADVERLFGDEPLATEGATIYSTLNPLSAIRTFL
jgi:hypothetical protein